MKSLLWHGERRPLAARTDAITHQRAPIQAQAAPTLNTILAVREHTPREIEELEAEIQTMHQRLGAAYARKRLLEQLLAVIQQADAERPTQSGMAVVR